MSEEQDKKLNEAMINERIEKIRKKNEEIQKRHMEVEADKQNADVFSSTVVPSKPNPRPKAVAPPKQPRERLALVTLRPRPQERAAPPREATEQTQRLSSGKIYSNFAEGEGPPPDPGYRFLADDERDAPRVEVKSTTNTTDSEKSSKKSARDRGTGSKARGRRQEQRPQRSPQKSQGGDRGGGSQRGGRGGQGEEKWRAERAAIDEARIQRQKTAEGSWRREWDKPKDDEEEEDLEAAGGKSIQQHTFGRRGGAQRSLPNQWNEKQGFRHYEGRLLADDNERRSNDNHHHIAEPKAEKPEPDQQRATSYRKPLMENTNTKPPAQFSSASAHHKPLTDNAINNAPDYVEDKLTDTVLVSPSRHVLLNGEDLRVLLRSKSSDADELATSRNEPQRRSFGSGRTGCHQKDARSSYSSQSEDEGAGVHTKYLQSLDGRYQGLNQSCDLPQLKVTVPAFGTRSAELYQDYAPPRPLHSRDAQQHIKMDKKRITSLPQRNSAKPQSGSQQFEERKSSEQPRTSKPQVLTDQVKPGAIDEGGESWDDYSDTEQT